MTDSKGACVLDEIEYLVVLNKEHSSWPGIGEVAAELGNNCQKQDLEIFELLLTNFTVGHLENIFHSGLPWNVILDTNGGSWTERLESGAKKYLQEPSRLRQLNVLFLSVASLKLFIRSNWLGPPLDCKWLENLDDKSLKVLEIDGEPPYELLRQHGFLVFAKLLLTKFSTLLNQCKTVCWWMFRCHYLHQRVMLERLPMLYKSIVENVDQTEKCNLVCNDSKNKEAKMQFGIEAALIHLHYFEVSKARSYLSKVQEISEVDFCLTGALGKRTYFQQKALPQLLLNVTRNSENLWESSIAMEPDCLPKDVKLTDDTVMNSVKFMDDIPKPEHLSSVEQAMLLVSCAHRKRFNAPEPLLDEEVSTFLGHILSQPQSWCIQFSALFERSKLESKSSRRVERSMMQMESLIESINKISPEFNSRIPMFFIIPVPPVWVVEKHLGNLFFSLGLTKSALEIFLRCHLWEDAVSCYEKLQRKDKAEALIRECLGKEESPLLLCLLGDVTNDQEHYQKAWELSKCRSSRAQRSLGLTHYQKKEFKEAIPYFEKSLELNSLQINIWFALGYSAMQVEDYNLAVKAYKRVVNLNPDSFEAWNNMSNAYIRLNQKDKAFKMLQESLKCNYEDWRIWENYLLVSLDVGAFEECISAYHRIMDIKGKHIDEKVAEILVKAVKDNVTDMRGVPALTFKPKLLELFGRITASVTNNSKVWHCYGELCSVNGENEAGTAVNQSLQCFQKSFRCLTQKSQWEKETQSCLEVMKQAEELFNSYMKCIEHIQENQRKQQLQSSARLMLKSVIATINRYRDNYTEEQLGSLLPELEKLQMKFDECN